MDRVKRNEVKCGHYLQYVPKFMVKKKTIIGDPIQISTEVQAFRGRSDFVISAFISDGGVPTQKLFIWELKAPQINIFNVDKGNKLIPSKHLVDAENKLLNYVDEIERNETLRESFSEAGSTISSRNVVMGGIIIGRNNNKLFEGKTPVTDRDSDYLVAKSIREKNFYKSCELELYTWDEVLHELKEKYKTGQSLSGNSTLVPTTTVKPRTKNITI